MLEKNDVYFIKKNRNNQKYIKKKDKILIKFEEFC